MVENNVYTLKIDEEFKKLIPPLSSDERKLLEDNIISDGCREPICVWNKTILDGHNRYEICTKHQIPFTITYIFLRSREEALAWICANQLGRRNITNETRRYLIGKRYEMEKILGAHNAAGTNQYTRKEGNPKMLTNQSFDETACRTRERLGNEYNISFATVGRYGAYANAIDSLAKAEPELTPKILSGKIKITHDKVVELSRLPSTDIKQVSTRLSQESEKPIGFSNTRGIFPHEKAAHKPQLPRIPVGSVKDMPDYDPDAPVLSLAFTIPSWVSSINRTCKSADMIAITNDARSRLEKELTNLNSAVDTILQAIREVK